MTPHMDSAVAIMTAALMLIGALVVVVLCVMHVFMPDHRIMLIRLVNEDEDEDDANT